MKSLIFVCTIFLTCLVYADQMPFKEFYGKYSIKSCKSKTDIARIDICAYKEMEIRQAPSNYGYPSTHFSLLNSKIKDDFISFTQIYGQKNQKIEFEKDGTERFLSNVENTTLKHFIIGNTAIKRFQDGNLEVSITESESSSAHESDISKSLLNHQLILSRIK
ncbi:MAG: hypothetical protein JNM24_04790 [Bdellovibrionaceae bacterium]|nr:hypothetical protein [Pseudobdellovibrionaceae bacterium]